MGKKRTQVKCAKCEKRFSILPREDGKPQRVQCYDCKPRAKGWQQ